MIDFYRSDLTNRFITFGEIMKNQFRHKWVGLLAAVALFAVTPVALALTVDDLVGVWNMSYDMGQGAQTGTITVTKGADGMAAISMNTQGGGSSNASNIKIEGDELSFTRTINAQGQSLGVNYKAMLMDGKLQGTFEVDLGGAAPAGSIPATAWTATKQ